MKVGMLHTARSDRGQDTWMGRGIRETSALALMALPVTLTAMHNPRPAARHSPKNCFQATILMRHHRRTRSPPPSTCESMLRTDLARPDPHPHAVDMEALPLTARRWKLQLPGGAAALAAHTPP
jgi:hypothetical protein